MLFRSSNEDGMKKTIELTEKSFNGLCFVNLVDFDALWGHRRDAIGYGKEIELFDHQLGQLIDKLKEDDLIILTADHGNDPTFIGTDHTREQVPFIAYSPSPIKTGRLTGRNGFGAVGATVAENFGVELPEYGDSYLQEIL